MEERHSVSWESESLDSFGEESSAVTVEASVFSVLHNAMLDVIKGNGKQRVEEGLTIVRLSSAHRHRHPSSPRPQSWQASPPTHLEQFR